MFIEVSFINEIHMMLLSSVLKWILYGKIRLVRETE
jgi:hypothetical protein